MQDKAALQTYRYLRIGLVGAVVLLTASILIEWGDADCWQTSVSAYYYTPVRAILVGTLIAVGFALIVIKGRNTPIDVALNFAGMLAPLVAVVPTASVGECHSVDPQLAARNADQTLTAQVIANIDNNVWSLLIIGFIGLIAALVVAMITNDGKLGATPKSGRALAIGLVVTLAFLVVVLLAFRLWDDFYERAHGIAAVGLFVFLAFAVLFNAIKALQLGRMNYFSIYLAVLVLMIVAAAVLYPLDWEYNTLVLEYAEIFLFGVFWAVQTVELWNDTAKSEEEQEEPAVEPSPSPA
jgi:hypothetical protein